MRIITNEIDIYKSSKKRGRCISEYIIYLMYENTPIKAYIEYGTEAKNKRISKLNSIHRIEHNITNNFLIN
jgi:hypothetical protein